jgi:hypothetical protein
LVWLVGGAADPAQPGVPEHLGLPLRQAANQSFSLFLYINLLHLSVNQRQQHFLSILVYVGKKESR